jgi:hypothetical protein
MPPVDVAAATWPCASVATAPTVPPPSAYRARHCSRRFSGDEPRGLHELEPERLGELVRAVCGEEHVRRAEQLARRAHRVANPIDDGDRARVAGRAVHDRCVELDLAVRPEHRHPLPALKSGHSSSATTGGLDHVERARAQRQLSPRVVADPPQRRRVRPQCSTSPSGPRDDAGSAMDDDRDASPQVLPRGRR